MHNSITPSPAVEGETILRSSDRDSKRIVIVGAGYAGLNAALTLADGRHSAPVPIELELVDQLPYHLVKVRLHEAATRQVDVTRPLHEVLTHPQIPVRQATVTGLDLPGHQALTPDGSIRFDQLVLALGSNTNFFGIPGLAEHAFPLDSLADAVRLRGHVHEQVVLAAAASDPAERARRLRFVIGGAGYTGIELAAELAELLPGQCTDVALDAQAAEIVVVDGHNRILPVLDEKAAAYATAQLQAKGVQFRLGVRVSACSPEGVTLNPGGLLPTATMIWAGGICGDPVLQTAGVELNKQGRLVVDPTWRLPAHPEVWAIGDCAAGLDPEHSQPVPATAQMALQEGRHVAQNILRVLAGHEPEPFDPRSHGEVVSLGHDRAVGWLGVLGDRQVAVRGLLGGLAKWVGEAEWETQLWRETHHLDQLY